MAIATLKGLVNKIFTILPYKNRKTSTTDPVEMNLDSSVPIIQNSLWLQHLKITAFWLQLCLIAFSLSLRTEILLCQCYTCLESETVGGLFCISGVTEVSASTAQMQLAFEMSQKCSRKFPGGILSGVKGVNKSHLHPPETVSQQGNLK